MAKSRKKATPRKTSRGAAKSSSSRKAPAAAARKKPAVAKKRAPAARKAAAKKPPAPTKKAPAKKATKRSATGAATKKVATNLRHKAPPRAKKTVAKKTVATKRTGTAGKSTKKTTAATRGTSREQEPRRAIYIDVENTSSKAGLLAVIDALEIDRQRQLVELNAVGNWRVVGQQVARELAGLGANLVHSAPAPGVRDWSDLWIAVAAGGWIARAQPGDILELVSNDRAFDAVSDAAAAQGVVYRRIQHRRSGAAVEKVDAPAPARRPRRRRPRRATETAAPTRKAAVTPSAPSAGHDDPHGATRDQMIELVTKLTEGRSSPWVNLDVLEGALKQEGFSRPPNSPRLVTRLRRLKDFETDSHGRVRVVGHGEDID